MLYPENKSWPITMCWASISWTEKKSAFFYFCIITLTIFTSFARTWLRDYHLICTLLFKTFPDTISFIYWNHFMLFTLILFAIYTHWEEKSHKRKVSVCDSYQFIIAFICLLNLSLFLNFIHSFIDTADYHKYFFFRCRYLFIYVIVFVRNHFEMLNGLFLSHFINQNMNCGYTYIETRCMFNCCAFNKPNFIWHINYISIRPTKR